MTTWVNHENNRLSEINQRERQILAKVIYVRNLKTELIETG